MRDLIKFKGKVVVTQNEGVLLGITSGLVVDEAVGRISALLFHRKWRTDQHWISTAEIVSVGPDAVVVSTKERMRGGTPHGRLLSDYRKSWVTTISGDHIGRLADFGTIGDAWEIHKLQFVDGSCVEMDAKEMVFGRDEILIPDFVERQPATAATQGFGARLGEASRSLFNGYDDKANGDATETANSATRSGRDFGSVVTSRSGCPGALPFAS